MINIMKKLTGYGITILLAVCVGYVSHIILDHIKSKTELNRSHAQFLNRSTMNAEYNPYKYYGETNDIR